VPFLALALAISVTPAAAATFTTLYTFRGTPDGYQPSGDLLVSAGTIYGTTLLGGTASHQNTAGAGTVFAINLGTHVETIVHRFSDSKPDRAGGVYPNGGVTIVGKSLYGTTLSGGTTGYGTVFKVNPVTGHETVLYSGGEPEYEMTAHRGSLYGTMSQDTGAVFTIDSKSGAENSVYVFPAGKGGEVPSSAVVFAGHDLYGTTSAGGEAAEGTLYRIDASTGKHAVLYAFSSGANSQYPHGNIVAYNGALYGAAPEGGNLSDCQGGCGTIYKFDLASRALSVVYAFSGTDGASPGGLVQSGGLLFGTTISGGANNFGCIFQLDPATGAETVLYSFSAFSFFSTQWNDLVVSDGILYGSTPVGNGFGTVYAVAP
jgi:uncharacterized repeat protein (TIGR03803 family)